MTVPYNEMSTLAKKIRSHLILIYNSQTTENGSGVLVQIKDHIFILTAAHTMFENLQINFGLPWHSSSSTVLNKWSNEELDVGFIELKPFEVDMYKADVSTAFRIEKKMMTTIKPLKKTIAICGYPSEKYYKVKDENKYGFIPVFLGCSILHPSDWPSSLKEQGKSSEKNIAIPYGERYGGRFFDNQGMTLEPINPIGFSGCGIWYFVQGDEHSNNPRYSLMGIQTSYFKQSQLLVGTYTEPLINEICEKYNINI